MGTAVAGDFVVAPAEHALRRGIDEGDAPAGIDAADAVDAAISSTS